MNIKVKSISTNTLFAAAIACFTQLGVGILALLLPFLLMPAMGALFGEELKYAYINNYMSVFDKLPMLGVGAIFVLVIALLFVFAFKKIGKGEKVRLWSIISLVGSFLLIYFSHSGMLFVAAILGIIGSVAGLIYEEGK